MDTRLEADIPGQRHSDPATAYIRTDGTVCGAEAIGDGDIVQVM